MYRPPWNPKSLTTLDQTCLTQKPIGLFLVYIGCLVFQGQQYPEASNEVPRSLIDPLKDPTVQHLSKALLLAASEAAGVFDQKILLS